MANGRLLSRAKTGPLLHNAMRIVGRNRSLIGCGVLSGANAVSNTSATGRREFATDQPLSVIQVKAPTQATPSGGNEATIAYPQIVTMSWEYPLGNTPKPFTWGGKSSVVVYPNQQGAKSDLMGVSYVALDAAAIRIAKRVASPPTSPAAAVAAGGALASGTTYYYSITSVDNGIESGPSTEVSATPSGGNLSVGLTWTANAFADRSRIYRSTSSDSTRPYVPGGAAKLYASVDGTMTSYVDTGAGQATSTVNPPATQLLALDGFSITSTEGTNLAAGGGAGGDTTGSSGAMNNTGPSSQTYSLSPQLMLGDAIKGKSFGVIGTSRLAGTGLPLSGRMVPSSGKDLWTSNWFDKAATAAGIYNTWNYAIGSAQIQSIANATGFAARLAIMQDADILINELAVNDIASKTWQQIATYHINLAKALYNRGGSYYTTTIEPYVTTTDACVTVASQTPGANEAVRVNYNNWQRNGFQVDGSGVPVLTGGTPSPYIAGYIEVANAVEVNAAGALTQDGGRYKAPAAATYTGQIATGSPSTTSLPCSGSSFTASNSALAAGLTTLVVKMTSGAAIGQTAVVASNTATALTLIANGNTGTTGVAIAGLTIAPSAGDTFDIYETMSMEGLHPTALMHSTIATAVATQLAAIAAA